MIDVLKHLLEQKRIKIYSCDSTAGQALLAESKNLRTPRARSSASTRSCTTRSSR